MHVVLQNDMGLVKEVKVGFSWTTLFFGFFPALFRGDLKWAAIIFIVAVALSAFTFGIGGLIADIIFAFIYNKAYIKDMIEKGYKPATEDAKKVLANHNILPQST